MVPTMPAKPLTPEQKADAARLKEAFQAWRDARRDRGDTISQEAAAAQLGFGQSALSQYLNGHIPLNEPVLWKFCELLGVAPEEISHDIAGQAVERSQKWAPTESALESLALDAFTVHGVQAESLRGGKNSARAALPKWLREAVGPKSEYCPDLHLRFADGSDAWVEVKSTRLRESAQHLARLAGEHPTEFFLLMAEATDVPRLVDRWLKTRAAPAESVGDVHLSIADEAAPESEMHRMRNSRPVWVVGMTQGGMPKRVWTDGDHPAGATDQYADVSTADPHAFACRVVGDSMVPRYMPGEYALVEPGTVPELEDDVLVRLRSGETMLKRLLSRRGGVRFGSYNTQDVLTFREEEITWMYYVAHPVPVRRIKQRIDLETRRHNAGIEQRPSARKVAGDGAESPPALPARRVKG